jgi:alpha-galactosidase
MADAVQLTRSWAEGAFGEAPAAVERDRLVIVHEDEPGDTKVNTCAFAARPPIRLGEKTYARGIGVNSHSVLRVSLTRPAARFRADIGLDRNVDNTPASVRFHVNVAGKDLFATDVLRPGAPVQSLDVPLAGAREFDLIVDDGSDGRGWDQGDWADARVVLEDGTELWLDDLAKSVELPAGLPFSFTYGGRPSADLLPTWKREVTDEEIDATRRRRTLTLTDPETGLEVRAVCTIYTDTPGADWTLYLTNRGAQDTPAIENLRALDVTLHPGIDWSPVLHRITGSDCSVNDWVPVDEPLTPGRRVELTPVDGRPSRAVGPFWTLDWGTAGVVTAIGWSAQWTAALERDEAGAVRMQAGMQFLHLKLRPGESIRSPRIMQLYWTGADLDEAHNLWRRTMLKHIVPQRDGRPITPPIVHLSTSFYELNDSTEANVLSHLEAIRGLGFEDFWLDAYWTRDGFPAGMGNYGFPLERAEPPDRFPHGLRPIGDAAHAEGMGFVVWFEPERVHPGTELAREHPEWVISPAGDGSGLLNLGLPEAREYMTRYLIEAIRAYGIDGLRIDYNLDPLPYWQFANQQDADRVGLTEIRYVEGLYRMWDDIRAAHPHLFIDDCASGGMRIDLETCSRSIPLWRTDATIDPLFRRDFAQAALQNQTMTAGLSRYLPLHTSGQMGATPYLFRSGFNGGVSFCEDCRPADYPKALLKQGIAEGKRLRQYFLGDFYPLTPVTTSPREWCVLQYHLPEEAAGMVVAFRRHHSPYSGYDAELRGIDEKATYEVTQSTGYEPSAPVQMKGGELRRLALRIEECPGSVVVEYGRR